MKKIYFLFAVLFSSVIFGQIVNIPDAAFKAKLLQSNTSNNIASSSNGGNLKIDANNDGEIQVSEALNVYSLKIDGYNSSGSNTINSLDGITSFLNLVNINIKSVNAPILDISGMVNIIKVDLQSLPNLTTVNTSNCAVLNEFNINGCYGIANLILSNPSLHLVAIGSCFNLTNLNLQSSNNITYLKIEATKLTSLDFSIYNMSNLSNLDINNNNYLTNINLQNLPSLFKIEVYLNPLISSLDLSNKLSLNNASITSNSSLQNLNLANCPSIQSLNTVGNILTNIYFSNNILLNYLNVSGNQLSTINFDPLPALSNVLCAENKFTTLDIRNIPSLLSFNCSNNPMLISLFLKHGIFSPFLTFSNNPNLHYICTDDTHIQNIITQCTNYGYNNVTVNSYCSFTPGGTFYTIQGETRYDVNNNGCDPADPKNPLQKFNISGANGTGSVIGNNTGQYTLPVQAGSHTITPVLENPSYFNITPTSFTANFPTQTSPLNQNFCMTANGNHNDLEVVVIPVTAAAPGFTAKYKIVYKNKGTGIQSGTIQFDYNGNLSSYSTSSIAPSSQSAGVLNYTFTNLNPFESREILVTLQLNTPTQTPPLNGGDVLNFTSQITGATDETPLDNNFALNQTVVNSFDPNDKTCLEGTAISQTKVGDYVHYLIRFENTGTANAQNIVVKDMIDTSKFDINSLVAMNGSHAFVTRITNPNTVEFIFEGIQLPFNDADNDGFVSFKIKTKSTLVLGDSFSNTANIYFDYNAPIVTNTYTTTVAQMLATQEVNDRKLLSFYPNPVEDIIHFTSDEKLLKLEIHDVSGRIVGSVNIQNNEANLSFLKTGNYLLKIFTKDKFFVNKIVKK